MAAGPSRSADEFSFVETGGAALEVHLYRASGAGGPTIVMLHEGLGSAAMWRDFPGRVAAATGAPVMVYSRRGYGGSPPRAAPYGVDFMHREALDALPALLGALGIARPVLFGHSDGGSIALIHAASHAAAGVVVMAPHIFVEETGVRAIAELRDAAAGADFLARLGRYHDDPEHAFRGWNDIWLEPAFRDWDIREDVARIAAPILAIQGESDQYGTMAQIDAIAAGAAGPVRLVKLADCGHSPHRDQPAAVLDATAAFINGLREEGHE